MKETKSHWTYNNEILETIPDGVFGFVYKITHNESNKFYIGKKKVTQTRKKPVKLKSGKKSTKRVTTESKWKEYTGSSKDLNEDIKFFGKDKFKFEILCFAFSQGQLSYLEENVQMKYDTLTNNECYNDSVGNSHFRNIKIDDNLLNSIIELKKQIYGK